MSLVRIVANELLFITALLVEEPRRLPGPRLPHFVHSLPCSQIFQGLVALFWLWSMFHLNLEQSLDCFILTVLLSAPQASCLGPSSLLEGADCLGYHQAQGCTPLEGVQRHTAIWGLWRLLNSIPLKRTRQMHLWLLETRTFLNLRLHLNVIWKGLQK